VPRLLKQVAGFPVVYRSWRQVTQLAENIAREGGHAEKGLLRELVRYLRGVMTMQNVRDNLVYVVPLTQHPEHWSGSLTGVQIVEKKQRYFHPIGERKYPKDPVNYIGFRWGAHLQVIHHVEDYDVFTDPHEHFAEIPSQGWAPHYLYRLGPPIRPPQPVHMGKIYGPGRHWAALDLLLTCETVAEARDRTNERLERAGEQ
jgi:hypothetical protein